MNSTLAQESRVMLAELLLSSKDATREWLRTEMNRFVDQMLHSIFDRLKNKFTNGLGRTQSGDSGDLAQVVGLNSNQNLHDQSSTTQIHQPSTFIPQPSTSSFNPTSSHFNPQFVNMNYSSQQQNGQNHLVSISNQQLTIQSQTMTTKKEIEPIEPTSQVQSSLYELVSNEQHSNNNVECKNSQISFSDTEIQTQPQQLAHITHNQFDDDEEFDCDECVDGGIEVKEEDDDEDDQVQEQNDNTEKCVSERNMEQSTPSTSGVRSSTRKRIQTKVFGDLVQLNGNTHNSGKCKSDQTNGSVKKVKRKQILDDDEEDTDSDETDDQEEHANNAVGEEIATECTTNPIQPNLAQSNRHLQCSHCHKFFVRKFNLRQHLRVHTGERPFQCDVCDKQFTQKAHLESHLRIHSGERPHQCRFCDQSFAQSCHRKRHEQAIHLHVKPYRCKQCGHTATRQSDVIKHIRVVHFNLPRTIKEQQTLKIIDHRDPRELLEKV